MARIIPLSLVRNPSVERRAPELTELRQEVQQSVVAALTHVERRAADPDVRMRELEREVRELTLAFGRALLVLFLALCERRLLKTHARGGRFEWLGRFYRKAPAIGRNLSTVFGVIRYHRVYMREIADRDRHGFHPLDLELGLVSDRFTWNVLAVAVRLATKLSFAEARSIMMDFVPQTPSTEVVQKAVLGFGTHTAAWVEHAPVPEDDGDVLVVQIDGKGAPMATARELARRRFKDRKPKARKRKKGSRRSSPRHERKQARAKYPRKPRPKKGDKSKNAKMATLVVVYTLRRVGTRRLEGPVNRRVYASFAPKRHAFEIVRRMADKRGFSVESGKLVQLVTDGDPDLARLGREFFPNAEHTVDFCHVCEYLWDAGLAFHKEGSAELASWVQKQRDRLFDDEAELIVVELTQRLASTPKRGPGNKKRRERLEDTIRYLERRLPNIRYGSLSRRGLELGSGAVEGAVKHVIGRRCDYGGMRWIKERAEALLQLRCIEVNGEWDIFERFVHDRLHAEGRFNRAPPRIQQAKANPLPEAA
jgi:hypothetical protein